jgi:hypothetical protein
MTSSAEDFARRHAHIIASEAPHMSAKKRQKESPTRVERVTSAGRIESEDDVIATTLRRQLGAERPAYVYVFLIEVTCTTHHVTACSVVIARSQSWRWSGPPGSTPFETPYKPKQISGSWEA